MSANTKRFYILLTASFIGLFFLREINLTVVDLGRHIVNGRQFIEQGLIVSTNHYSYTEPDFSTITHHWGSGVLFYLIHRPAGFLGLTFLYLGVMIGAWYLMFRAAEEHASTASVLLATVIALPLITERVEIRPEGFSYLLIALYTSRRAEIPGH